MSETTFYCKNKNSEKVRQPEINLLENLKRHFSWITFYGLHAGNQNNQNSI